MTRRFILTIVIVALLALALGTGLGIMAAGTAGSSDDPLITLSYLNDKFKADLVKDIDAMIKARGDELSAKVDASLTGSSGGSAAPADTFKVVVLSGGQTLTLKEGSELLVREGTALVAGAALANTTTGESAQVGATALINNMYLATSANAGINAGTEAVKALVRGAYTIAG